MSDDISNKPSWVTFAAVLGAAAVFFLVLSVTYIAKKPDSIPQGTKTPEQRRAALSELRAKEKSVTTSYAWIDQGKGVVQLPLDRAIELTIQELATKGK